MFRVYGENIVGPGPLSLATEWIFTPPTAATSVSQSDSSESSVEVIWEVGSGSAAHIDTVEVSYRDIDRQDFNATDVWNYDMFSMGSSSSRIVTGLRSNTNYEVRVRVFNPAGWGPFSSSSIVA